MDWKQELFKRLDALGEKLGVAANHLWYVLVRQGMAEAVGALVLGIISLIGLVFCVKVFKWARKMGEAERENLRRDWSEQYVAWAIISGVCGAFAIVGICINTYEFVVWAINPEYFALEKVLSLFGK